MASALFGSAIQGFLTGSVGYGICRGFNYSNPFEKAVLVTVLVGFQELAGDSIRHIQNDRNGLLPRTRFLIASANLLAIPCALYAGRVFKFKEADYLQIIGLASLGQTIIYCLSSMLKGKKT